MKAEHQNLRCAVAVASCEEPQVRLRALSGAPESLPDQIRRVWAEGGAKTLVLARLLRSARSSMQRGSWSSLWDSGQMPFSRRKGQMLLVIADGLEWVDAQTFAQIPHGWSILYCLARLQRSRLEGLIASGLVHPRLKLAEARQLVAQFQGAKDRAAARRVNIISRFENLERFVESTRHDWVPHQRRWATDKLHSISLLLKAESPTSSRSDQPAAVAALAAEHAALRN